jgi:Flp pilus assembly protein TadG
MRWLSRLRDDRGAGPIELAILGPLIILLLFGAAQVAAYHSAQAAALTAAQAAVTAERQYDAEPGDGKPHAEQFLTQTADWLSGTEVSDPIYTGDQVSYVVTGVALSLVPGVRWQVRQSANGTLETFTTG